MREDELMPAVQQVTLERVELGLSHRVGGTVRESVRLDVQTDMVTNDLVYRLGAHVLAERLPPVEVTRETTVEFQSPASPFQHWKQKHAQSWWLRWFVGRWPVRQDTTVKTATLTVDLTKYRSYPEANYALPELGAPILIHTLSTDWGIR